MGDRAGEPSGIGDEVVEGGLTGFEKWAGVEVGNCPHPGPLPSDGRGRNQLALVTISMRLFSDRIVSRAFYFAERILQFPLSHRMEEGRGEGSVSSPRIQKHRMQNIELRTSNADESAGHYAGAGTSFPRGATGLWKHK